MPRKTFANGFPLPASDLNTYLMDQSVQTYGSAAARTSAIATPIEGQVTYLEDTNLLYVWDGSAWTSVGQIADGSITNAKLANSSVSINGNSVALGASTTLDIGRNKVINGAFDFWQRGTSFTSYAYTADRWINGWDNAPTAATWSRQTFTPGTAPVAGYEGQYFYRQAVTTVGATNTFISFGTKIEDVRTLAGQTVTLSFWAKSDSSRSMTTYLGQIFGSGGSSAQYSNPISATVNGTWTRYTGSITLGSMAGKTIGADSYLEVQIRLNGTANGSSLDIWGVQLEAGSVATPFQRAAATLAGELAACQRYFQRIASPDNNAGPGVVNATSGAYISVTHKQKMRATASVSGSVAGSATKLISPTGTQFTVTGFSAAVAGDGATLVNATIGSASLVIGQGTALLVGNPDYIDLSAEL